MLMKHERTACFKQLAAGRFAPSMLALSLISCASGSSHANRTTAEPSTENRPTATTVRAPQPNADAGLNPTANTSLVSADPDLKANDRATAFDRSIEEMFTAFLPQPAEETIPWPALKSMGCLPDLEVSAKTVKRSVVLGGPNDKARAVWLRADTKWGDAFMIINLPYDNDNQAPTADEFRAAVTRSVAQINKSATDGSTSELVDLSSGGSAQLNHNPNDDKWVATFMVPGPCTVRVDIPDASGRDTAIAIAEALSTKSA